MPNKGEKEYKITIENPGFQLTFEQRAALYTMKTVERFKHLSIEQIKQRMLFLFPKLKPPSSTTIRRWYKQEMHLSYKKFNGYKPDRWVNLEALAKMLKFIKDKVESGYRLVSLDETGFSSKPLNTYSWSKKSELSTGIFNRMKNLTLLTAISSDKIMGSIFIRGGCTSTTYFLFL